MSNRLSHTARGSKLTHAWHVVKPLVPSVVRYNIRNKLQFLHSRHLTCDDSMLLSYPKSGSTWLRSMLLMCLTDEKIPVSDLAKWIPPLHMANTPCPSDVRIVRSHDSLGTPGFKRAGKILILVRDPRAVAVSYFHHQKRRGRTTTIEQCTNEMLTSGFDEIGSWQSHVQHIQKVADSSDVKIVRYEDLLLNTQQVLTEILSFYDLSVPEDQIQNIIEENSPERLREKRKKAGVESTGGSDVRNAKASAWVTECPDAAKKMVIERARVQLEFLGYDTAL